MRSERWDDEEPNVVPLRAGQTSGGRHSGGQYAGASMAAMPRATGFHLGAGDVISLLLREWWVMALVFVVIFGLGAAVAMKMPKSYTANASLLMKLGKDYVYQPAVGDAATGATATVDEVVQSETEILNSTDVKTRVIARLGYKVILPDDPALWSPKTPADRADSDAAALKVLTAGFAAATAPGNGVVRLSFKHENAESASLILNTLIDEYQASRQLVYHDAIGPALEKQKADFDSQLAVADQAYQSFLMQNGVGDFDAAKATYSKIYDQVQSDLYAAGSQLSQDQGKLGEVEANLKTLSPEMSIERDLDLTVPAKILSLQQQRADLLSRYLPDAPPVKDIDAQIASYQGMVSSGQGVGEATHKLGSNPVYQAVLQQKFDLEADMASQEGRRAQLQAQADQVTRKLQDMQGIEGQYTNLSTQRNALQDNIKTFTQRIQQNDAANAMSKGSDDTVRVVEKASLPDKPKSLRKIILIMAFLFAGFTALCAGLLRVYTRKGFVNAAMASRALDLPVLAQAGVKTA